MDPFTLTILIGGYFLLKKKFGKQSQPIQNSLIYPPNKVITLIGTTGAGKSTTANALLGYDAFPTGIEHGTTANIAYKIYKNGYFLQDTPGLLDQDGVYVPMIMKALQDSELGIYIAAGQLYRQEVEFLEELNSRQKLWNQESGTPELRKLALFINKSDIKNSTMDSKTREREVGEIKQQVKNWIPEQRVVFGASAPVLNGRKRPPQITHLDELISTHMQINSAVG